MKQEEKAKRYDELLLKLKKAKVDDNVCDEMYYRVIDDIVPELKESEDEKILRHLKAVVKEYDMWAERGLSMNDVLTWLEKQGEQKQDPCVNCKDVMLNCHNFPCIKKRAFKQGKSVFEVIKEEPQVYKADGEIITYSETDGYKLAPNFKVKYAGREYNVLEVKDVSGVRFYGIEDEPNHIDYVKAENCERVDGYNIKESGSLYPTKSAVFSEQPPTNKVETKFHEGDWVVNKFGDVWHIDSFDKKNYQVSDGKGNYNYFPISKQDKMRLYTIEDAKDGDVLNSPSHHLIWIHKDNEHYYACVNMNYVTGNVATDGLISIPNDACPATKEQRNQLKKAMRKTIEEIKSRIKLCYI